MQKRKVLSVFMVLCMLVSMTACKLSSKNDKAVIAAANDYAEALLSLKAKSVANLTKGNRDVKSSLELLFDFELSYGQETGSVYNEIVDMMTFEVDEDSVDTDSEDGQIDIIFTMPDYEEVAEDEDNMTSPSDFIDALEDADTIDVVVTLEFELDDGKWLVSNHNKVIDRAFPFLSSNIVFLPDLVSAFNSYSWYNSDNGVYTNSSYINFWGQFNNLSSNDINVYFTVERDGVLIHTSDILHSGDYYYRASDDPDSVDGCVPAGEYTITCYDTNDRVIASGSCTVIFGEIAPEDYFQREAWYGSYVTRSDGSILYTDVTSIDLDCLTVNSVDSYYTVSYNGTLVYTSANGYYARIEGYYNETHCGSDLLLEPNGYLPSGEYTISFYTAFSDELIHTGSCTVVNTEYPDGIGIGGAADDGRGDDEFGEVLEQLLNGPVLYDAELVWDDNGEISDNGLVIYGNVSEISCVCNMSSSVDGYYEVYQLDEEDILNATTLHTGDELYDVSTIDGLLSADMDSIMDSNGNIQDGFYAFVFGTTDNDIIAYGICLVVNN